MERIPTSILQQMEKQRMPEVIILRGSTSSSVKVMVIDLVRDLLDARDELCSARQLEGNTDGLPEIPET